MNLQKLRLGQLKPADGATTLGDVYYPQTVLLAPFEGTNGSTSTSDLSTRNHSSTFSGSSLSISTSQSKFGSSSLYHNNQSSTTDHVSFGSNSDFLINQNTEYTLEFWYRARDTATIPILGYGTYTSAIQFQMYATGDGVINFKQGSGSWGWGSIDITGGTLTVDTWKHIAVVRNAGTLTVYVDGTSIGSASTGNWGGSTGTLRIGTYFGDARAGYFYMDDLRITKGIARYTGNFTPPTTSHLTSSGDVNKQIVVNSDADGVAIGTGGINQARVAKAWVNFEGTDTSNVRGSYNVSSVSDRGTGLFTVNFSTAMTDANYAVNATSGHGSDTATTATARTGGTISTTACHISTGYRSSSSVLADMNYNAVTFFGN
jgi:hypothetical protein